MTARITAVDFHGETLLAAEKPDGVFVAVKPISDRLGLEWSKQLQRIKRDAVLAEGMSIKDMLSAGGVQPTVCPRLNRVNTWLVKIDASRVRPEAQPRVLTYQLECADVLFRHFYGQQPEGRVSESIALRLVTEARQTFGTRAASELWFRLGLPVVPRCGWNRGRASYRRR